MFKFETNKTINKKFKSKKLHLVFINPIDTCMSISINSVNTWLKNVFLGKRPDLVFHNHPMVFRFPENIDFFPHFYENKQ